jgi:hypothetical protein
VTAEGRLAKKIKMEYSHAPLEIGDEIISFEGKKIT